MSGEEKDEKLSVYIHLNGEEVAILNKDGIEIKPSSPLYPRTVQLIHTVWAAAFRKEK